MKSWLGASGSGTRRVSRDLHFGAQTSVWSEIAARSHLIVAAVGSAALLGLAGTAIWLALPSGDSRIVGPVEAAAGVEVASAAAAQAAPPGEQITTESASNSQADAQPASSIAPALAANQPVEVAEAEIEPLDPTDPRWVDASAVDNTAPVKPSIDPKASRGEGNPGYTVAAYTGEDAKDGAATAAIPTLTATAESGDADQALGRPGRTVRSVTMRARPHDRGGVLGTVPGRANVQVVSCDGWCEIIYKGKRGFVFRRFLENSGR